MKLQTIFRYHGGKKKIADNIVNDIASCDFGTFVDVFTGGGSISVEMLNRRPQTKIIMNDLDKYMSAFWDTLCHKQRTEQLVNILNSFGNPTIASFMKLRNRINKKDHFPQDFMAFLAVFFNRTTFSGIFKSGPLGGRDQSGKYKINSRYNLKKIVERIYELSAALQKTKSKCYQKDFREIIEKYGDNENCFLYLDPPYMKQGKVLYNVAMSKNDFEDMAAMLKKTKCKWIVSHDNYYPFISLFKNWANIADINNVPYTINSIKDKRRKEILIANFDFVHNKRSQGRPISTNNFYVLKCANCKKEIRTNPTQINNYSKKYGVSHMRIKTTYLCRDCRKIKI
jgi:DNA adenine methylase